MKNLFATCAFFVTLPLVFAGGFFLSIIVILSAPFLIAGVLGLFGFFAISSKRQELLKLKIAESHCRYIFFEDLKNNVVFLNDPAENYNLARDLATTG